MQVLALSPGPPKSGGEPSHAIDVEFKLNFA